MLFRKAMKAVLIALGAKPVPQPIVNPFTNGGCVVGALKEFRRRGSAFREYEVTDEVTARFVTVCGVIVAAVYLIV